MGAIHGHHGLLFGGGRPAAGNPSFANVVSLLHMDGANGSTTFTDQTGKVWTPNGNAQITTAQSKFGGSAGALDGSGDYLSCNNAGYAGFWGLSAWTAEAWVRLGVLTGNQVLFCIGDSGTNYLQLTIDSSIGLRINKFGSDLITQGGISGLAPNVWAHIAFVRNGSNLYAFIDGTRVATSTSGGSIPAMTSQTMLVGVNVGFAGYLNAWLDDVRFSKEALYTADFAPPTSAFPNS